MGNLSGKSTETDENYKKTFWNKSFFKIFKKKTFYRKPWIDAGILRTKNVIDNRNFLSYMKFCSIFIKYYIVLSAISKAWIKSSKESLNIDANLLTATFDLNIWSISMLDTVEFEENNRILLRKVNFAFVIRNPSLDCSYVVLNFWPNLSFVVLTKLFL